MCELSNKYIFSVIIPVLNEAEIINTTIEHLCSLEGAESVEIIVVDADPHGSTISTIDNKSVITETSDKGRARQMNTGAEIARGEIILFLHADTKLPPKAFEKIKEVLKDQRYVGGAFDLGIDSENFLIKCIACLGRIRPRLTHIPYGDQALFLRKKYFDKIGRFKEVRFLEDVDLMRRIKKLGDKICILPDRVETSARRWEAEGILYTSIKNQVLFGLYYLGVSPDKLAKHYRMHSEC